jgi:hypothetical protein
VYLTLVLSLVAAQSPTAVPGSEAGATAYLDVGAEDLVRHARERRNGHVRAIAGYRAFVRQRMYLGLRALRRDRVLYRQEMAARIAWHRGGGPDTVSVVGAREGVPIFSRNLAIPEDLTKDAPDVVFDPADDRLVIGLDDSSFMQHPLAPGGESNYRFQSGDTTEIGFADHTIKVIELRVAPRRADVHLMAGSLWIDAATGEVVEVLFRLARPFDLERDTREDVSKKVPGFLKPIRAELRYLTVEYAQWDSRWWLPRIIAFDGVATVGSLAAIPVRFEREYSDYEVTADSAQVTLRAPDSVRVRDSVAVLLVGDSAAVLRSDALPPSFITDADAILSAADVRDLIARMPPLGVDAADQGTTTVSWRWLARFNRVEGLSLGAQVVSDVGPYAVRVSARLGAADLEPNAELGITRRVDHALLGVAGYRRLAAANPWTNPLGLGNSLNALVLGRDDGAYYRAAGAELTLQPGITAPQWYAVRLFWEHQARAATQTQSSLPHWVDPAYRFLPNIAAAPADQFGVAATLRGLRSELEGDGSLGTFRFARVALTTRLTARLPVGLLGAVEAAGGTSVGSLPVQSLWYLGGPATLRGYDGLAAAGEAFWRGRVELADVVPFPRLALFSDVGWAGDRAQAFRGRPLMSVGVGASVLDGLLRADLARALRSPTGWRLDLYVDAIL